MLFGCCFTRYKYLEAWEDMELRIHERQYLECFLLALLPALVLSLWLSWWFMLLASVGALWRFALFEETEILCLDEVVWQKNAAAFRMG